MGNGTRSSRRLAADDPFVVHIQFRLPSWRAQRSHRRLAAAVRRARVPATLTLAVTDVVVATVSVPAGTIRQALRGEPAATEALNAVGRLAEILRDLDPVLVDAPEPGAPTDTASGNVTRHRPIAPAPVDVSA